MYAGVEEEEPHEGADAEVEDLALDAQDASEHEDCKQPGGYEQEPEIDVGRVEDGDDEDTADVVDHSQRGEENLERDGHSVAEHCEDAE